MTKVVLSELPAGDPLKAAWDKGNPLAAAIRHYRKVAHDAGQDVGLREARAAVERICAVATTGSER